MLAEAHLANSDAKAAETAAREAATIAETFVANDGGTPVSRYLAIDTMITVIDASRFLSDYRSQDTMRDRGLAASDRDVRSVVDVLVARERARRGDRDWRASVRRCPR